MRIITYSIYYQYISFRSILFHLFNPMQLDGRLVAKVADFGISKIMSTNLSNQQQPTVGLGTSAYCSPEFLDSLPYDHAADCYSFGVLL